MLSDSRTVLSARHQCCQYLSRTTTAPLCGLLIKLLGLPLGEFDGEESVDAGVQVEGLTGPAGSDSGGVWMVEAVHLGQPIMLSRLDASAGEVKLPRQILVSCPRLARLPVTLGEHPAVELTPNCDAALLHSGVMPSAQQDQITQIGAAAGCPRDAVMGIQVPAWWQPGY